MNQQYPNVPYPSQGNTKRRRVGPSTFIVGAIAALFIIAGASTSGFGGALIIAGFVALLTAIYVIITGRPSWIRLPGRKAGAIVLAASMAMWMAGGLLLPPVEEPVTTASDSDEVQAASTPMPEPTRTATPTSVPTPTPETTTPKPSNTPEPKPEKPPEQPKDQPPRKGKKDRPNPSAGTALAQLATIEIKGRAPKTGYDRDNFGSGWTDIDHNGCDRRIICTL